MASVSGNFLRTRFLDASQTIAHPVEDFADRLPGGNVLFFFFGQFRCFHQVFPHSFCCDTGVAKSGLELGVGLSLRFHDLVDFLGQLRMLLFSLLPAPGGEVIHTPKPRPQFIDSGVHIVPPSAKNGFRFSGGTVAILDGHASLELASFEPSQQFRAGQSHSKKPGGFTTHPNPKRERGIAIKQGSSLTLRVGIRHRST